MKNYLLVGNKATVIAQGKTFEITLTPELVKYLSTPDCECKIMPHSNGVSIILLYENCPAHKDLK